MKTDTRLYVFYSWNGEMENEEIVRQMRGFAEQGVTGVFIHARAGLSLPYFSEKWFQKFGFCLKTAKAYGMETGIYDENGWPSGFGGGAVNGLGEKYWQKKLFFSKERLAGGNIKLLSCYRKTEEGYRLVSDAQDADLYAYLEYRREYVDLLAPYVTQAFIREVHEKYRERFGKEFGKSIKYLFTDEPQLAAPYCYTDGIEEIFAEEYGEDLLEGLWQLHSEEEGFNKFRYEYRSLCSRLFHRNFTEVVADWCAKYGLNFTGHFACEEHNVTLNLNGGVQNGYRWMQVPGVDALGRRFPPDQLFEQLVSVKDVFRKKYVLSETFGCAGWSTSLETFLFLWKNQAARGVNFPCLHLSAYSVKGIRKRAYPAFFSYQESWWNEFHALTERMRFLSDFVGEQRFSDILVLSSEDSSLGIYPECEEDKRLSASYTALISELVGMQAAFDVVNGRLFDELCRVGNGKLIIGESEYTAVIVSESLSFSARTEQLLKEASEGGIPVGFDRINPRTERFSKEIGGRVIANVEDFLWSIGYRRQIAAYGDDGKIDRDVLVRRFGDRFVYFNRSINSRKRLRLYAQADSLILYSETGEIVDGVVTQNGFWDAETEGGAIILAERGKTERTERKEKGERILTPVAIYRKDPNALTLDRASYSVDGGAFSEETDVLKIEETLSSASFGELKVRFRFYAEAVPEDLCLALEDGADKVTVNGQEITLCSTEWFVDRSIRKIPVADKVITGENTVELIYAGRTGGENGAAMLDSEEEIKRNLFTFDLEIENVYLTGSFSVRAQAYRCEAKTLAVSDGKFIIARETPLTEGELTEQGLWFYRGKIQADYILPERTENGELFLTVSKSNLACVWLIGSDKTTRILFSGEEYDVSAFAGQKISLEFTVGNRNLLGPHHHKGGDPDVVGGNTFRGVRGFEDEWLESRYDVSTATEEYHFVPGNLPKAILKEKTKTEALK